jgi:predicted lactoylglutathione lyase
MSLKDDRGEVSVSQKVRLSAAKAELGINGDLYHSIIQMRQKLNLITLGVADVERSAEFYEALGWRRSEKSQEGLVLFPLGGMVLALHPIEELAADTTLEYQASQFSGITISYNAESEKEVDEIFVRVAELGATIVKPAQKVYWGGYSGYFKDLDGFLFEVAYNPFWELNENGDLML